jgi:hypothetical protein
MMTKISTSKYFSSILKPAANYIFDEGSAGKAMFLKFLLKIISAAALQGLQDFPPIFARK